MSNVRRCVVAVTASLLCAALAAASASSSEGRAVGVISDDAAIATEAASVERGITETIWFQGFLADVDTGDPIDGTVTVEAEIFDASTGGTSLWGSESHSGVVVVEGWFNIELGSIESLPGFDAPPYYLELTVDGELMDSRQKLASVPMAYYAGDLELPFYGAVSAQGTAVHVEQLGAGTGIYSRTGGSNPAIVGIHSGSEVAIRGTCLSGIAGDFIGDVSVDGELAVTGDVNVGIDARVTVADTLEALAVETYRFQMTRSPSAGMILTCDDAGNGYWDWPVARADLAEMAPVSSGATAVEPGDVMVIDPLGHGRMTVSIEARSRLVAGICSTAPGSDEIPLAVVGIVPCKVSAENGAIAVGDLLVTSGTPGYAMREASPAVGTVLGKALEPLEVGTGVIRVLVTLQ